MLVRNRSSRMYELAQLRPILKTLDDHRVDCVVAGGFAIFLSERTFRLALSSNGQQISSKYGILLEAAIPTALFAGKGEKLARFAARRLPLLREKLTEKRRARDCDPPLCAPLNANQLLLAGAGEDDAAAAAFAARAAFNFSAVAAFAAASFCC
jgi:hypothetical protein